MENETINDLEFDNLVKSKNDRDLLEFVAHQSYDTNKKCTCFENRIGKLESRDHKSFMAVGGGAGTLGAFLGGFIMFIFKYWKP